VKKIAIMQPYFFPYIGYFSLIKHTDQFILFDPVQFIRHGWIERNRVLKQNGGWLYVKVPLEQHDREALIKEIRIDNSSDWKRTFFSQLETYKKIAPYYREIIALLHELFSEEFDDIVSLDKAALEAVCKYLGINCDFKVFSQMKLEIAGPKASDEWALNTCLAMGGIDEYWNPPGGKDFFDRLKYEKAGLKLVFQEVKIKEYKQGEREFEPGLSIIDVMMFNSPEEINKMLDEYELG
jgi:hypothetical protein